MSRRRRACLARRASHASASPRRAVRSRASSSSSSTSGRSPAASAALGARPRSGRSAASTGSTRRFAASRSWTARPVAPSSRTRCSAPASAADACATRRESASATPSAPRHGGDVLEGEEARLHLRGRADGRPRSRAPHHGRRGLALLGRHREPLVGDASSAVSGAPVSPPIERESDCARGRTVALAAAAAGCSRVEPEPKPHRPRRSRRPLASVCLPPRRARRGRSVRPSPPRGPSCSRAASASCTPAPGSDAARVVVDERARAKSDGRDLVVYVGAKWCEPCQHFHRAAKRGTSTPSSPTSRSSSSISTRTAIASRRLVTSRSSFRSSRCPAPTGALTEVRGLGEGRRRRREHRSPPTLALAEVISELALRRARRRHPAGAELATECRLRVTARRGGATRRLAAHSSSIACAACAEIVARPEKDRRATRSSARRTRGSGRSHSRCSASASAWMTSAVIPCSRRPSRRSAGSTDAT